MDKKNDHITKPEEFLRYRDNQMSAGERHAFEKKLLEDDFEQEALEGMEQFATEEISSDLSQLQTELSKKSSSKSGVNYWRVAAAIVLLGVFSYFIYYVIDGDSRPQIGQQKEIEKIEQKSSEAPAAAIPDSTIGKLPPAIAYNKKIEKEDDAKVEIPVTEQNKVERGEQEIVEDIELNLDMDVLEAADEKLLQEELEPAGLPTLAHEPEPEIIDQTVTIQEVEATRSKKTLAPTAAWKEDFDNEMKMSRSAAPAQAANTRTITGRIMSVEDDEALPGVNVIVKGSGVGTITDIEGNYSIEVPENEGVTLVYSSVGYSQEEVEVNEQSEVNVNIEPDITALSEIVVTGYGTQSSEEEPEYSFTPPRPVGGQTVFKNYVTEYLKYPESALDKQILGTVKLKFTVAPDGTIKNMEVIKSLGSDFDQEAMRLVHEGPAWEPAQLSGEIVEREVKVKIRFRAPG
jgi:TonB family protein